MVKIITSRLTNALDLKINVTGHIFNIHNVRLYGITVFIKISFTETIETFNKSVDWNVHWITSYHISGEGPSRGFLYIFDQS